MRCRRFRLKHHMIKNKRTIYFDKNSENYEKFEKLFTYHTEMCQDTSCVFECYTGYSDQISYFITGHTTGQLCDSLKEKRRCIMNIPNQWKVLHEALGADNEHPELEYTFALILMKLYNCEKPTTPSNMLHDMMVKCPDMYMEAFELVHYLFREVEEHGLNKSFRAILRLNKDLKFLHDENPEEMSAAPMANNFLMWNAVVFGPKDSPFEDGIFNLIIEFSEDYPYVPPVVRFTSKMFHPNVYDDENPEEEMPAAHQMANKGDIQLEILQKKWSPANNVGDILKSVRGLLSTPGPPTNPPPPPLFQHERFRYWKPVYANPEAAELFNKYRSKYKAKVLECVDESLCEIEGPNI